MEPHRTSPSLSVPPSYTHLAEMEDGEDINPQTPSSSATWGFFDAHTGATPTPQPSSSRIDLPRPSRRTSSLPRALYQSTPPSIFGGPATSRTVSFQQDAQIAPPPALAVSPPSQEDVRVPLPALSTLPSPPILPKTVVHRQESWYHGDEGDPSTQLPQVEKDTDDPNSPPSSSRANANPPEYTTLSALNRLFTAPASPEASRTSSYTHPTKPSLFAYTRNLHLGSDPAGLPDHLYNRGLLEGRHSDITVRAFGQEYKLHRLILDRAPFFRSALSEPWLESSARETTVHPEDIDPSITQASFELALKRLYGCNDAGEESRDAVGLFATGCWLEMQDLIESSIDGMLRQMTPATLAPLIKLVTSNYYGRAGDKILASAKAMLCRDGWQMPLRFWEGIPGDIVREIVGGDGFFIDGEWERWTLAKRILDRRLKARAIEAGLVDDTAKRKVLKAPDSGGLMAVRFDGVYRKNSNGTWRGWPDAVHRWIGLYTHPEIEPLLVLLDEGIHYVHLEFEQLQCIREAKDVLGFPVLPHKVIADALWQQMELRQRVLNTRESEMELGISVSCTEDSASIERVQNPGLDTASSTVTSTKGKHRATSSVEEPGRKAAGEDESVDSGSWDGNGRPRRFWIPTSDCNIVMGFNADPVVATSNNTTLQRHANRLSATLGPEDVQWASDFSAVTAQAQSRTSLDNPTADPAGGIATSTSRASEVRYSHLPPFRFAASFPNPRLLKEKKRVYSRTVFYAGSLWNIYIQKVASSRSKQLGVYLHRAKERDAEEVLAGSGQGSVDERIGQLEREMLLRGNRTRGARYPGTEGEGSEEEAVTGADAEGRNGLVRDLLSQRLRYHTTQPSSASRRERLWPQQQARRERWQAHQQQPSDLNRSNTAPTQATLNSTSDSTLHPSDALLTPSSDSESSDADAETPSASTLRSSYPPPNALPKNPPHPTLPPYVDARPTIKTYFKIYSPSRGGRLLSVYESAPDRFNFSQSWGWKSSTLMLDEGIQGDDGEVGEGLEAGGEVGREGREEGGRLRFMVVIGNI